MWSFPFNITQPQTYKPATLLHGDALLGSNTDSPQTAKKGHFGAQQGVKSAEEWNQNLAAGIPSFFLFLLHVFKKVIIGKINVNFINIILIII